MNGSIQVLEMNEWQATVIVDGVRGRYVGDDVCARRIEGNSRHIAHESAEQLGIHPDPPSSDISTVPLVQQ